MSWTQVLWSGEPSSSTTLEAFNIGRRGHAGSRRGHSHSCRPRRPSGESWTETEGKGFAPRIERHAWFPLGLTFGKLQCTTCSGCLMNNQQQNHPRASVKPDRIAFGHIKMSLTSTSMFFNIAVTLPFLSSAFLATRPSACSFAGCPALSLGSLALTRVTTALFIVWSPRSRGRLRQTMRECTAFHVTSKVPCHSHSCKALSPEKQTQTCHQVPPPNTKFRMRRRAAACRVQSRRKTFI